MQKEGSRKELDFELGFQGWNSKCRRESFPEWPMAWKHPRFQMKSTVRGIATSIDYIICNFYGTFVPSLWMSTASF